MCKAILKRDHDLKIELPDDRLTPFIPVRLNYVRWMQQLLDTTSSSYTDAFDRDRVVDGLDIGTGATAIYALLACRERPRWRMVGTDIDLTSLTSAARNIALNDLEDRIKLLESSADDPLIPLDRLGVRRLDFVMCNPPFYTSVKEMQDSLTGRGKSKPPSTICTGCETEMVTSGGDLGFVKRMIDESKDLGERVQWYSAMMGKLDSLYDAVAHVKELGCSNWATHCLTSEGGKTRRWAVAWSWSDLRPPDELARGQYLKKEVHPFPSKYDIPYASTQSWVLSVVQEQMESLDLKWRWDEDRMAGLSLVACDVWSRRARRMKTNDPERYDRMIQGPVRLVVKVVVSEHIVQIRWVRGTDKVLFEQFCEMLKRKLDDIKAPD